MPPLRHSISQIFAPHPALALIMKTPQSHEQAGFAASAVMTNDAEMTSSSLQSQRPTVSRSIPSTSSTRATHTPPPDHSFLPTPSPSPSICTTSYPLLTPPLTQIEALPPHTTFSSTSASTSHPASSPIPRLAHTNGTFILDSATRHPVFFTDRLRRAPSGVMTCGYGNEIWRSGSPVARGYVYESGGVEEREAKL
ncbi:hypothetical protein DSL72_003271 [Monilinia vaccinii-corymbosi]|uniref:Uncharacterized protein n=1 Tax=Monilinia vaccinii-corymbosi TaxID=61207 RepID=A0A8A3P0R1_9HELO|nr:hypothetical protein DSL72_003271 [Monilinia vaccinii-corymbosi]